MCEVEFGFPHYYHNGVRVLPGCTICGQEVTAIDQICAVHYQVEVASLATKLDLKDSQITDLLTDLNMTRAHLDETKQELTAELEAARARFSDTVCGLRADLELERQRHEVTSGLMEDLRAELTGDLAALVKELVIVRGERDAAKSELQQVEGKRRYWQADAEATQRYLERWKGDAREVAQSYFRLRRLCYATAAAGPILGATAIVAATYWHRFLPWLVDHAPSSGSWCLLAVGLACLLVGRRWRGAVVEPYVRYAGPCPAEPLHGKLAARIEGLSDEECSVEGYHAMHRLAPPREIPEQALPAKECAHGPDWPFCNRCGWHTRRPTMTPVHRCRCGEPAIKWDRHISGTGWMPWCGTSGCCC